MSPRPFKSDPRIPPKALWSASMDYERVGPPIDMKLGLSLSVYPQGAWTANACYALDEAFL